MSIDYKDYYAILGISNNATKQEIAKAFKSLARKYHPDVNKGDKTAEDKFKEINEAYEVLKDDEKRRQYDSLGSNWQSYAHSNPSGGSSHFSDFFESIFGGGFSQSSSFGGFHSGFGGMGNFDNFGMHENLDRSFELEVTLEEVASGAKKPLSIREQGSGTTKNLEVTIPQGIQNHGTIRLKQQGNTGRNGKKGDLYITILYKKHPYFTVEGKNIIYTLHVEPWVLVLGGNAHIPTLYGNVDLSIPQGTKSGAKFRMQGKGLGKGDDKGSMFVVVQGDTLPQTVTPEQKEAWEKLRALYEKK